MSIAVVYLGFEVPEKNLIKTHRYKAYLSKELKEQILNQISSSLPDTENYTINMHVEIELKEYKNDPKNT